MKHNKMLLVVAFFGLALTSCDDNKMEWYKDPSHGAVSSSELPLVLAEKISRYEPLKNYLTDPGFKLGLGVGLDAYLNDEVTTTIANENFNDISIGYLMKHGPMIDPKTGELQASRVTQVSELFAKAAAAGLSVYGHCLIWHQNQNAGYLNGLIADRIEITPEESDKLINVLSNSFFDGGSKDPWGSWGNSSSSSISAQGEGFESDYAMVLVNPKDADSYSAQCAASFPSDLIVGKTYCYSLMVKSDVSTPQFQLQVQNSTNYGGEGYREMALTPNVWTLFEAEFVCTKEGMDRMCINFGKTAGTYYIDNVKFGEKKEDPDSGRTNLLANGDFKENKDGWGGWGSTLGSSAHNPDEGNKANGCLQVVITADNDAQYAAQINKSLVQPVEAGKEVYISYYIKVASGIGSVRISTVGSVHYQGDQPVTTEWARVEWPITTVGDLTEIRFDLGKKAGTYFIDDVVVSTDPFKAETRSARSVATRGVAYYPLTEEEKQTAIYNAMESWISNMVTLCKDHVHAWDVVNEPMSDKRTSEVKSEKEVDKELASDEFYWQDYFATPKDYAVEAFKLTRKYGNADDKLFINDYNLEYNLNKCDGLIEYVNYLESKGAKVDGIGTQMHIGIDTNKDNIAQMFQKLAASGKLIKVSELDIKVNTATPTTANLAAQADMYQYVIDMYMKYIPVNQRYGITIWGVSDNAKEHENWLTNDAPNLWDANYARKHAYKGVADGLAGKDVSAEFSGDLEE